jgi:peptide/nickel transport system substrate-binding protein
MRRHAWWLVWAAAVWLACGPAQEAPPQPPQGGSDGAGAAAPEAGTPVRGDWMVHHQLSDPENLNPYTSSDKGATDVLRFVFQSLLGIDPETLEQFGVIARELPEISEDQLTYTFRLRDDVTFQDGKPLSAADVVFSLKVIRHPKVAAPQLRNYFDSVRDAVAVDAYTVRIDLSTVYFRNRWTLGGFEILPRHYYDPDNLLDGISVAELNAWDALDAERRERAERFAKRFNEGFQRRPLGSGAYALVDPERDWVTGERIVLHHRPDFWAPGDVDRGDGWVDRVVFRTINDREAALVAFKAGDLDYIESITPIQATRQTDDARFRERSGKHAEIRGSYAYLGWNMRRKAFQDRRVRQALSHLVDKQNLVDKVMLGLARPVEGPIPQQRPEYLETLRPWEFSPEKAKALLAEAGWQDADGDGVLDKEIDGARVPLRFEIISNAGNDERKKVGLAVIDSFKRHGIDASFRSIDWSIMLDKVSKFDFDAVVLGWTSTVALPPDLYQIWHSSQAVEDGSNNSGFENAEADRILEEYRVTFDAERRKQLYGRLQEILYEEQPYTFLFAASIVSVWDRRFEGVRWYPGLSTDFGEWWVPESRHKY